MHTIHFTAGVRERVQGRWLPLTLLAVALPAMVAASCGGGNDGNEPGAGASEGVVEELDVSAGEVDKTIERAIREPVDRGDLDPLIAEALTRAAAEPSQEQLDQAFECWQQDRCQFGDGEVTLGIADGFGGNTWREFTRMEINLQALTYPEIGEIIYTDANGEVSQMASNIRSMTAQGVDVMVEIGRAHV